jgi:hypothetical protein
MEDFLTIIIGGAHGPYPSFWAPLVQRLSFLSVYEGILFLLHFLPANFGAIVLLKFLLY